MKGSAGEVEVTYGSNREEPFKNESKEESILELLVLCAEQNVSVPEALRSNLLDENEVADGDGDFGDEKETNKSTTTSISKASSLLEECISKHVTDLAREEESAFTKEVREMYEALKFHRNKYDVRIIDGSYTITNVLPENYNFRKDKEDSDVENPAKKEHRPHIDTVTSSNRFIQYLKKLVHCCRTGEFSAKSKTETTVIMDGINLQLNSGKMYLILGAPGCGKSTLLKMIAQNLREDKDHVVGGTVSINGVDKSCQPLCWTNLVGYIDQIDRLHSLLTVKETLDFAFDCRLGDHRREAMPKDDPEVQKMIAKADAEDWLVMMILKAMGLARVKDTFVGDDSKVRGVSGGERKRVTVSEMMCIGAPIICLDEMSTGLDAATTYDIVKLLGETTRLTNTIKIVSLLQPPPETVALFDEIILLDRGRVIYFGPVDDVVGHFEGLGYNIPDRMDPADWLQTLPTPDGANFLQGSKAHLSNEEFVEKFMTSDRGYLLTEALKAPLADNLEPIAGEKEYVQKFKNPWYKALKIVFRREALLWWRDKYQLKARIMQDLIMGIVVGTVFWQVQDNPQSVVGVLYQSLFFISMGAMLKVAPQIDVRGVFYKQQDANFYPTWVFVVGRSMAALPTSIIDALFYGTIIYWFCGLAYNDGASVANFFVFLLIVLFTAYSSGLMFSIFSAIVKDRPTAQACMSITVVLLVLFSGFTVQPDVIPAYWIWMYWINLFAWMLRALLVNEYQSGKYDTVIDEATGTTEGDAIMSRFGMVLGSGEAFDYVWVWYGILFAVAICLVSAFGSVVFLKKIRFETGKSLAAHAMDDAAGDGDDEDEPVALDFQRVDLTFTDIHYTVTASTSNEKLELLKGIDGFLESGKMTALMGSSGAGKTTLMDVLALRKSSGEITGEVRLNGHLQEGNSFRRCTGYVEQFDTQTPQLTIRETVEFSAKMRLDESDPKVTPESTAKFVDQTLRMLELTAIQHYLVGSDISGGLSFEQRKRLSIAVELAANPSIIFLDEPTSGLDARAASIVMAGLKRIAESGRAVCATIHQPSVAIFNSFDSLLLLKRGGETVFFGDLGHESSLLIEYLERYPSTPEIKPGENPATWMLTTIGAGSSGSGDAKPFDYAASYAVSKLRKDNLERIAQFDAQATDDNLIAYPTKFATPARTQSKSVFWRMWKVYWRSPGYNRVRTIVAAVIALLFGSVFASNRTPSNESDMNSRVTSIYITALFLGVNAVNTVLPVYEVERNMYYRHKGALMYNFRAFNRAWTLAELPFILFSAMMFCVCFYFLVGFSLLAYKFFLYYMFIALNGALWTFLGQAFMALFKDVQTAQGSCAVLIGLSSIFTGLLIRPQYIDGFWLWAYWTMPGHYVLEGLLASQFHNDDTIIEPYVGSPYYKEMAKQCGLDPDAADPAPLPEECWGTAEDWIYISFGGKFVWEHVWVNTIYCLGVIIVSKAISYWALKNLNYLAK